MSTATPTAYKPADLVDDAALLAAGFRRARYSFSYPAPLPTWQAVLAKAAKFAVPAGGCLAFSDGKPHNDERLFVSGPRAFEAIFNMVAGALDGIPPHTIQEHNMEQLVVPGSFACTPDEALVGPGLIFGRSWNCKIPASLPAIKAAPTASSSPNGARCLRCFCWQCCACRAVYALTFGGPEVLSMDQDPHHFNNFWNCYSIEWEHTPGSLGNLVIYFPVVVLRAHLHDFNVIKSF